MPTTPIPARASGAANRRPTPSATATAHTASALAAPTRTAMPAQKSPAAQRRTISALIGPGGPATDHPSTKPVARRAGREAVMCLHREAERAVNGPAREKREPRAGVTFDCGRPHGWSS